jgi:hypothetical protein
VGPTLLDWTLDMRRTASVSESSKQWWLDGSSRGSTLERMSSGPATALAPCVLASHAVRRRVHITGGALARAGEGFRSGVRGEGMTVAVSDRELLVLVAQDALMLVVDSDARRRVDALGNVHTPHVHTVHVHTPRRIHALCGVRPNLRQRARRRAIDRS